MVACEGSGVPKVTFHYLDFGSSEAIELCWKNGRFMHQYLAVSPDGWILYAKRPATPPS